MKNISTTLSATILTIACASGAAHAATLSPITHWFGAWSASCSTIEQTCVAQASSQEGGATIALQRANAPERNWEITLVPSRLNAQGSKNIQLTIGPWRGVFQTGRDWHPGPRPNEIILTAAEPASALLTSMIRGMSLALALDAASEEDFDDAFSLEGISAALLWIDEAQNKIGTPRVAQTPQSLPDVSTEIRKVQSEFAPESVTDSLKTVPPAVLALRLDDKSCDPLPTTESEEYQGYGMVWLSADQVMFILTCVSTPALPINRYIVATAPGFSDARVLDFQVWDDSLSPPGPSTKRSRDTPWLIFDPFMSRLDGTHTDNTGSLSQIWRWDGQSAHLIEVNQMRWQGQAEGPTKVLWQVPPAQR